MPANKPDRRDEFLPPPEGPDGMDGTPGWAYDEDGYCVVCGNGHWKYHMPECGLRDHLDTCKDAGRDALLVQRARALVRRYDAEPGPGPRVTVFGALLSLFRSPSA